MEPIVILADWDEQKGPLIVDATIPAGSGVDDGPEVLVTRCYISAQSIFAGAKFSKISFNLPMVSIQKLSLVFFDIVEDESVRGGKRPFMMVILVPIDTSYAMIDEIGMLVSPFMETYKKDDIPRLETLQQGVQGVLSSTGEKKKTGVDASSKGPPIKIAKIEPGDFSGRIKVRTVLAGDKPASDGKEITGAEGGGHSMGLRAGTWSGEEIKKLSELQGKGMNAREIAQELHRTLKDVRERME